MTHWIVVADQSQVRIYEPEHPRGPLTEVHHMENPDAQQNERDLVSDRPGRSFDIAGQGRHAMEPEVTQKEHSGGRFAKQLAHYLDTERARSHFDTLTLVAGPVFLGLLRQELSPPTARTVGQEIQKNLGPFDERQIREWLPETL